MRIGGGGSADVNLLQSDASQFRNQDFVVDQGLAFLGGSGLAAVAAQYSYVQLYNPAGSGVRILLDAIVASVNAQTEVWAGIYDTQLGGPGTAWYNAHTSDSQGNGLISTLAQAGAVGTKITAALLEAFSPWTFEFRYPIQLDEGDGLIVRAQVVNVSTYASFFGREV